MQSSNPVLRADSFTKFGRQIEIGNTMTMEGTVLKTAFMLLLLCLTAGFTWVQFLQAGGNPNAVSGWMMLGLFGGFGAAIITAFKPMWATYTAPAYALLEGLFIGAISSMLEAQFPGIVIQATSLTFGTLGAMLIAYQTGLVRATEKFKLGVFAATGSIALVYLFSLVLSFFGIQLPFIYEGGTFGILFSLFVVVIAALNLVIDFDMIEQGAKRGAPKFMEWYGAFALMVTLIWLYIEFLRLLSKMRER